jgi:hypothetical protein
MSLCPVDFKPCEDDLCHGAGCIRSSGEPMLEICHICKDFKDEYSGCRCDNEEE